jgi:DNA polymerase-3 subunit delta
MIGSLYNYFSKIYLFHSVARAPEPEILATMGLHSSFFLREYRGAARHYSLSKAQEVIHILREFDLKSKGVGYNATGKPEGELLKEMTWRILHV